MYKTLDDMPSIINIEVFRGECPCKCFHCPVGVMNVKERTEFYGIKHMEMELFTKICDELVRKKAGTLRIHSVGEPLLWCNLIEALEYAKANNIITWMFTSLVTDDYKLLEVLCDNLSIIEVSVNSIENKDYVNTKGINAFEVVNKNIEYINRYIQENNLETRLIVSRVQSENELQDEQFVTYWKNSGLVSDAFVRTYHTYNNLLDNISVEEMHKEPCIVHWKRFNISVTGDAVVCFNELFKKEVLEECILGNIYRETIHDIWHGERLNKIRNADIMNKYIEEDFSEEFPCNNCLNCQAGKGRVTSEYQVEKIKNNIRISKEDKNE